MILYVSHFQNRFTFYFEPFQIELEHQLSDFYQNKNIQVKQRQNQIKYLNDDLNRSSNSFLFNFDLKKAQVNAGQVRLIHNQNKWEYKLQRQIDVLKTKKNQKSNKNQHDMNKVREWSCLQIADRYSLLINLIEQIITYHYQIAQSLIYNNCILVQYNKIYKAQTLIKNQQIRHFKIENQNYNKGIQWQFNKLCLSQQKLNSTQNIEPNTFELFDQGQSLIISKEQQECSELSAIQSNISNDNTKTSQSHYSLLPILNSHTVDQNGFLSNQQDRLSENQSFLSPYQFESQYSSQFQNHCQQRRQKENILRQLKLIQKDLEDFQNNLCQKKKIITSKQDDDYKYYTKLNEQIEILANQFNEIEQKQKKSKNKSIKGSQQSY